jgi:1-acyl-sn-glycerol-3-phosphate acyltransferase
VKARIGAGFLRAAGWRIEGHSPRAPKVVVVAAPHTSNWDLLFLLAFAWACGVRMRFMMKHTLFRGPAGTLFRALGGIPIERRRPGGVVGQMVDAFARADQLALVIPPEGTRGRTQAWKSGFYHIAREADVPVVLSYLDYARKSGGFGPEFRLCGEVQRDMDRIRDFYVDKVGLRPGHFGEIRLPEEGVRVPA